MSAGAVRAPLVIPLRPAVRGVPKSHIDTNTRLEIISETPNVDIYFTVNGNKPVIHKSEKDNLKTGTYKFRTPFTLPSGTHVVRAVAFLPDTGSESNVVTKRFDVAKAEVISGEGGMALSDDYGFLDDLKAIELHRRSHSSSGLRCDPPRDRIQKPSSRDSIRSKLTKTAGRKESNELSPDDSGFPDPKVSISLKKAASSGDLIRTFDVALPKRPDGPTLPDPSLQFSRLQRITDVLRCSHCLNPRSATHTQNFCTYCGQPLPPLPTPHSAVPGIKKLGQCATCGSTIPLNFPTCLVCESSLYPAVKHERVQEYRLCTVCGSINPSDVTSCLTCEARVDLGRQNLISSSHLYPTRSPAVMTSVQRDSIRSPQSESKMRSVSCPHCQRENHPDARFCDRCGLETISLVRNAHEKPPSSHLIPSSIGPKADRNTDVPESRLYSSALINYNQERWNSFKFHGTCVKCGSTVTPGASFCSICGSLVERPTKDSIRKSQAPNTLFDGSAMPLASTENRSVVANAATQTVGLFYPSSAELRRKENLLQMQRNSTHSRESASLLKAISPGRGFWRKQLEHIIAHLKVYTNNNPEFRAAIGEPRMGKLVSADLVEDGGYAIVTLIYSLPNSNSAGTVALLPTERRNNCSIHVQHRNEDMMLGNKFVERHESSESSEIVTIRSEEVGENRIASSKSTHLESASKNDFPNLQATSPRSTYRNDHSISLDQTASSDLELENFAPSVSDQVMDAPFGELRRKIRTLEDSASGVDIGPTVNRQSSGKQRVHSGKKPVAPKRSKAKQVATHHGEAGVALLRQSKLSTVDRSLLENLSKPGDKANDEDIHRLLDEGADPNCTDADGRTPLLLAVHNRRTHAVPILIEAGAKPNRTGPANGNTALHEAVLYGFDGVELVDVLLQHGANPKAKNKRQDTPHSLAIRLNCEPVIRLFLAHMGQAELNKLTKQTTRPIEESTELETVR